MAWIWLVLWPDHVLDGDSPGTKSETVLCPVCGMSVWPVMAYGVDWSQPVYGLA